MRQQSVVVLRVWHATRTTGVLTHLLLLLLLLLLHVGWSQTVPTMPAGELPLHKVFVKSQLDLMTANAWMAGESMRLHIQSSSCVCCLDDCRVLSWLHHRMG
jgi:hypothetical protein